MAQLGILEVKVTPDLEGFGSQVSSGMRSIGQGLGGLATTVGRDLVGIGASVAAAGGLALGGLALVGIKSAASLQTAELQFQTLLGSADAASKKVDELFDFAKRTPFEASEVIAASRQLQIFGKAALNTDENLTLVGDAAAATGQSIQDVAFWTGRAYDAIKSGRPWGEAGMRLQEMGVLSAEGRNKIEDLTEAGASADEQWAAFVDTMDDYSGAMDRQSASWEGLTSNLKDAITLGSADLFQPMFESLSRLMAVAVEFSESAAFDSIINNLQKLLEPLTGLFDDAAEGFETFSKGLTSSGVDAWFGKVGGVIENVSSGFDLLYDSLGPVVPILAGLGAAFASTFLAGVPLFGMLFTRISPVTGLLLGFVAASDEAQGALRRFGSAMADIGQSVLPQLQGPLQTIVDNMGAGFAAAIDNIVPGLTTLAETVLPALASGFADASGPLSTVMGDLSSMASDVLATLAGPLAIIAETLLPAMASALASVSGPLSDVVEQLGRLLQSQTAQDLLQGVATALGALAGAAGAVLGAGLSILADVIGVLANNADIAIPAIAGLAGAFALIKVTQFGGLFDTISFQLWSMKDAIKGISFKGLADSAKNAAQNISGGPGSLVGGMGALAGGLAIGASVYVLTQYFQDQAKAAQEVADRTTAAADAVEQFGNTSDIAYDQIVKVASDELPGKYDAMADAILNMGISSETLGRAMQGNGPAMDQATEAIHRFVEGGKLTEEQINAINEVLPNTGMEFGNNAASAEGLILVLQTMATEYQNGATAADANATSVERAREKTDDLTRSTQILQYQMEALYGSQLGLSEQQLRLEQGFTRIKDAIGGENGAILTNTGFLDTNTAAGQSAMAALQGQVQGIWDYTGAQVRAGASTHEATSKGMAQRQQLIDTMYQLGFSKQAVEQYIHQWGLTPDSVHTAAQAETAKANQDVDQYQSNLDQTKGHVNTTVNANTQNADSALAITQGKMEQLDGFTATVSVQARIDQLLGNVFPSIAAGRSVNVSGTALVPSGLEGPNAALLGATTHTTSVAPPAGAIGAKGAAAAVVIQEAQFNEPADFDTLINRVNLALAAGRL